MNITSKKTHLQSISLKQQKDISLMCSTKWVPEFTLLIYGALIIVSLLFSISCLLENTIETKHKDNKILRQHYSSKTSKINTNTDIFN